MEDRAGEPAATPAPRNGPLRHGLILCLAMLALVAAAVLEVHDQQQVTVGGFVLPDACIWQRCFGWECPGCGLTRSITCLAHGDLARSWHFHAWGWAVLLWIAAQLPYRTINLWRRHHRREDVATVWMRGATWVVALGIVAHWAGRQLCALLS